MKTFTYIGPPRGSPSWLHCGLDIAPVFEIVHALTASA